MAITPRLSVFGSNAEHTAFTRIESEWEWRFNVFLSLPFSLVIDFADATLNEKQREFLFTTSLDFTLTDKTHGKPLLSVECDGLGSGFGGDGVFVGRPILLRKSSVKDAQTVGNATSLTKRFGPPSPATLKVRVSTSFQGTEITETIELRNTNVGGIDVMEIAQSIGKYRVFSRVLRAAGLPLPPDTKEGLRAAFTGRK